LKFLSNKGALNSSQAEEKLNALTPAQKELFAKGLATDMAAKASDTNARSNVLRQFNTPSVANKLRAGLGPYADKVESFLRVENQMDQLRTALGNSRTAHRTHDQAPYGHGMLGAIANNFGPVSGGAVAGAAAAHETGQNPIYGAGAGAAAGLAAKRGAMHQRAVQEAIAKMLTSSDPAMVARTTSAIAQRPHLMSALRGLDSRLAIPATRAIAVPASESQQQQPVARAHGGAVRKRLTHEQLVQRLMDLSEKAKNAVKSETKSILNVPDNTVAKALSVAQKAI
jgi:hypothetical protein